MVGISLYKSETLRVEFYKFGWILVSLVLVLVLVEGEGEGSEGKSVRTQGSITVTAVQFVHLHYSVIILTSYSSLSSSPLQSQSSHFLSVSFFKASQPASQPSQV